MSSSGMRITLALAIAFTASVPVRGHAVEATSASTPMPADDPALLLVQHFHMGKGLESLANQAAHGTTTFAVIVQHHGVTEAERLLEAEIARAAPKYQNRWDQNLAAVYARHLSAEELRSLATLGASSPYAGKFQATHGAVAAEMRSASSNLLLQLVSEALASAMRK